MKKTITTLSICFVLGVSIIVVLFSWSDGIKHRRNSFIRLFPSHIITFQDKLDIVYNSYYLAGSAKSSVYLGNYTASNRLLVINENLKDTQLLVLKSPDNRRLAWGAIKVYVDSPDVYMIEDLTPSIIHIKLPTLEATRLNIGTKKFRLIHPIARISFLIKTYDSAQKKDILEKFTPLHKSSKVSDALEKQIDGVFCTDGMIHVKNNRIIYLYYYRNQFFQFDTNLNLIKKGHTIDTTNTAQISISTVRSSNTTTFSSPPLTVNKRSDVAGNWLFVNSTLLSNNEDESEFKKSSIIDIYSLKDNKYHFSIHLPNYLNNKMRDFIVQDNMLYALYDHYLLKYRLDI